MNSKPIVACAALLLACAGVFAAAINYQLLKKIAVPGTGGWDYVTVDDAARRVYISHSTQVDVLDADSFAHVAPFQTLPERMVWPLTLFLTEATSPPGKWIR